MARVSVCGLAIALVIGLAPALSGHSGTAFAQSATPSPSAPATSPSTGQQQSSGAQLVAACAIDLIPHEAAGICAGQLMEACMTGVASDHVARSLGCWQQEEQAWDDWAEVNQDDAADRLGDYDPKAPEAIAAARGAAAKARDAVCSLQLLAWPQDDDGPLMQARCRVRYAAQEAIELYWLGVP